MLLCRILFAVALLGLVPPGRSADVGDALELPIVVVVGTNFAVPRTLSADEFGRSVHLQETAPGLRSPYLGAFTGNQVAQSVDGVRFSNALFRTGPNQYFSWIPDAFVERVAVSDGGNVGGTIDRMLGVTPSHLGVTFNSALGFRGTASFREKGIGFALSTIDHGDVHTARGIVPHSSYNQQAVMVQAELAPGQRSSLMRTHSRDLERTDKWNGGLRSVGYQAPAVYTWERQDYALLKHEAKWDRLTVTAAFQSFAEHIRDGTNPIQSVLNSHAVNVDWRLGGGWSVYSTNSLEDITYDSRLLTAANPRPVDQETWLNFKQGLRWAGRAGPVSVVAAAGYKEVEAGSSADFRNVEGSLNLGWRRFFASYDRSTNTPSYFSLKQSLTSGKGASLPNPDLTEEHANTFRIGYATGVLYVDFFEKRFSNAIQNQTVTSSPLVYRPYNGGSILAHGGSFGYVDRSVRGSRVGLEARLEYNFGRSRLPSGVMQPTDKTTSWQGYLRLNHGRLWADFGFQPRQSRLSPSDLADVRVYGHHQGYRVLNFGYRMETRRGWSAGVALNNALANRGRVLGSSVDVPGRAVELTLRHAW